jgi:phosphate transport system substrate-binding protein
MDLTLKDVWTALAKDVPDASRQPGPQPLQDLEGREPGPARRTRSRSWVRPPPPAPETPSWSWPWRAAATPIDSIKALKKSDEKKHKAVCHGVREDGAFIEAGENDNLIVQKLVANPKAVGIFGYSFLDQNADKIQGLKIGGVEPTYESISSGEYPVSRSIFFYVKNAHVGTIPGIKEYVTEFTSDKAWGPEGYLADKGLIALPDAERAQVAASAQALTPMEKPAK